MLPWFLAVQFAPASAMPAGCLEQSEGLRTSFPDTTRARRFRNSRPSNEEASRLDRSLFALIRWPFRRSRSARLFERYRCRSFSFEVVPKNLRAKKNGRTPRGSSITTSSTPLSAELCETSDSLSHAEALCNRVSGAPRANGLGIFRSPVIPRCSDTACPGVDFHRKLQET